MIFIFKILRVILGICRHCRDVVAVINISTADQVSEDSVANFTSPIYASTPVTDTVSIITNTNYIFTYNFKMTKFTILDLP